MSTEKDKDISTLLRVEPEQEAAESDRMSKVLRRVRASVGQRDSLLFSIVKFWAVVAEMVAPIFAQIAERRASASSERVQQDTSNDKPKHKPQTPEGK